MAEARVKHLLDYRASGQRPSLVRLFVVTFTATSLLVIGMNSARWIITRGAPNGDGFQQLGWPEPFFERGGIAYHQAFSAAALLVDCAVAVGIALALATLVTSAAAIIWRGARIHSP
jgi:hypothetical protein